MSEIPILAKILFMHPSKELVTTVIKILEEMQIPVSSQGENPRELAEELLEFYNCQ